MTKLIFPKNKSEVDRYYREAKAGNIKRIRQGIYTDAPDDDIPNVIENKWFEIVDYLYPSAIASHSTAYHLRPINGVVYITAPVKQRKKLSIADVLTIEVLPGNVDCLTEPFVPCLFRSNIARYLLENLQTSHDSVQAVKTLGKEWAEKELCKLLDKYGEDEINHIRDTANVHAQTLNLEKQAVILDSLIGAILSTRPIENLRSPLAIAHAKKKPFDNNRIGLFKSFADYLMKCHFNPVSYSYNTSSWRNLSFYESYFSNYIEGTEFEIDEAEKIVFEKAVINNRHEDSHDVLSVFDIVNDYTEMATLPDSPEELISILKQRHAIILHERQGKHPGKLKTKANKAGDTLFVLPEHVEGTLTHSFDIYQSLPKGLHRAIFMQFWISECHPFDDGNGRLARIMMNSELVATEQHKIIVPTVHRDSYLNGLRHATRSGKFRTITKVFAGLQAYTASIDWLDYGEARETLELHMADKLPDQGIAVFNKQLSKHKFELPVG